MKQTFQKILGFLAKKILAKYKPRVIGITGSVGKTSTKEAVATALRPYFNVRQNQKNYNNEIGLPLTIIGAETGGRSVLRWLAILARGFWLWIWPVKYPEVLVLEMGADRPGDIKYLTDLVRPEIGIVTAVAAVHTEFFGTIDKVAEEKSTLIKVLPKEGTAILNYDDPRVRAMKEKARCQTVFYGFDQAAAVRVLEAAVHFHSAEVGQANRGGINFKLASGGSAVPIFLAGVLGKAQVYAALAAAAAGLDLGLNLVQVSEALRAYRSPAGRMNVLPGVKNITIIDDTYNASPASVALALQVFKEIPKEENSRFYAVLGDMLELGQGTEQMHREIGWKTADSGADTVIACGPLAKNIAEGAIEGGLSRDMVFHFAGAADAGLFLQERIKSGDVVLVKGSQGMRMERVVKELMAEPERAGELLVRQGPEWVK